MSNKFDDMYYESKENFYDRVNKTKKAKIDRRIDSIDDHGADVVNSIPVPGIGLVLDTYYGVQHGKSKALKHKMNKGDKDKINELYKKKQMKKEKIDKMRKRKIDGKDIDEDLFKKRKDSLNKTTKELGEMMRYRKEKRDKMRKSFESVVDVISEAYKENVIDTDEVKMLLECTDIDTIIGYLDNTYYEERKRTK